MTRLTSIPTANCMPSQFLHGIHEPGGEHLMPNGGWIVFTFGLGRNPNDLSGFDFRPWAKWGCIARLNHGYGSAGTIPQPTQYEDFSRRVANFVKASQGCSIWIIGNEPNHSQERPGLQAISATNYALCYHLCQTKIRDLPEHLDDQICPAPVAPWNNETGDWLEYWTTVLNLTHPNALAIHTYTHGSDPRLIADPTKMGPPFQNRYYNFRAYQDFMTAIPAGLRNLPVYITETDQNDPWADVDLGWVRCAYANVDAWNRTAGTQKINALCLYRWPRYDRWAIDGKLKLQEDFKAAVAKGYSSYVSTPETDEPRLWRKSEIVELIRQLR